MEQQLLKEAFHKLSTRLVVIIDTQKASVFTSNKGSAGSIRVLEVLEVLVLYYVHLKSF